MPLTEIMKKMIRENKAVVILAKKNEQIKDAISRIMRKEVHKGKVPIVDPKGKFKIINTDVLYANLLIRVISSIVCNIILNSLEINYFVKLIANLIMTEILSSIITKCLLILRNWV